MVRAAKQHEGRPFHLIATHCQQGEKAEVVAYIRSQGLEEDTPNVTVSKFGGHPGVKGNGHVPYYMVFDHTGKLRRQHMGGPYHGGDDMGQFEWVERLLDEAPGIWLGEEPFEHIADLAKKVETQKGLGAVAKTLEAEKETAEGAKAAEMERLYETLTAWRDRRLAGIERLLSSKPDEVLDGLKKLGKELKGSALAEPVDQRFEELSKDPDLKTAIALQKTFEKTKRKIEKLKLPKAAKRRGLEVFDPDDKDCREAHTKSLERAAKKLREAVAGHEELPIANALLAYAKRLDP